jgi:parallel beta-helix repeat protein
MDNNLTGKGLGIVIFLILGFIAIASGIQLKEGEINTTVEWFEDFDDGDISDWIIENPWQPETSPITIDVSDVQYNSSPYSLLLDSPHQPSYTGRAWGPDVQVNLNQTYTVEFWFRWNDFHYVNLVVFGHVYLYLDIPDLPILIYDSGGYHYVGPNVQTYCPSNTWTHFLFTVNPDNQSYSMVVNGNLVLTFNYEWVNPEPTKFGIADTGPDSSDYFDHCYYDDIHVYQASENQPSLVYVDDDFDSSTPGWDYDHFDNIQDGIDAVEVDGTVYVYNGTYYENVIADKSIDLLGENRDSVIIDGGDSGPVVHVTDDWTNISGFTIQDSISECVYVSSTNVMISNNKIQDNDLGLYALNPSHNNISGNMFTNNRWATQFYGYGHHNVISNNVFIQNTEGAIYLWQGENYTISNNVVNDTYGYGIILLDSDYNVINNNFLYNNIKGIGLDSSSRNTILENDVLENTDDGINLLSGTSYNVITRNRIFNNADDGIQLYNSCNNNLIHENLIYDNDERGIQIQVSSNNNKIFHNNIFDNPQNTHDECSNVWYNASLQEGNYYDDYAGEDDDNDGIGDQSYEIPGGSNQDLYPLMTPYGPPNADFTYTTSGKTVSFDASLSYDYDGEIVAYQWDFGDGGFGTGMTIDYLYGDYGTYEVTLNVTDDDGLNDSVSREVNVIDNVPPVITNARAIPSIQAPGGYVNTSATVTDDGGLSDVRLVLTHPDDDNEIISMIDNKIGDTYYHNSTYEMIGTYEFYVWAVDTCDNNANSSTMSFEITDEFVCDAGGPYNGYVTEVIEFKGHVVNGVPPYTWEWHFGDGHSSSIQNPIHIFTEPGNYTVTLFVTDNSTDGQNNTVHDTTWTLIQYCQPPLPPTISGPKRGVPDTFYDFVFLFAEDPNGDDCYLFVNWSDGDETGWLGPYASGSWATINHNWSEKGTYTIRARVKNSCGESPWSSLDVTMPRNKMPTNFIFQRLLRNHPGLLPFLYKLLSKMGQ